MTVDFGIHVYSEINDEARLLRVVRVTNLRQIDYYLSLLHHRGHREILFLPLYALII